MIIIISSIIIITITIVIRIIIRHHLALGPLGARPGANRPASDSVGGGVARGDSREGRSSRTGAPGRITMENAAQSMNIESMVNQIKVERAAQAHVGLPGAAPNETKELFHHTPGHESGKQAGRQAQKHNSLHDGFFRGAGEPREEA